MEVQARLSRHKKKAFQEERDVFKEIPLRYLGYANEVGESFRHIVPVRVVYLSYVVASGYVAAHAVSQGRKAHNQRKLQPQPSPHHHSTPSHKSGVTPSLAVTDTLLWQGFASIIVPGFTINRICALSRVLLNRYAMNLLAKHVRRWAVTGIGLGSIPFIIYPIDRSVDKCMDWLIRPWLRKYFCS